MVLSGETTARIRQVLEQHPEGISITDLVKSVEINRNTAGRYLENLLMSGQVEMRRFGMAKLYTLTKRLPVSSVLSLSSELVLQLDAGQRLFYANDPLLRFLGVPAKDLFGKNIEFTRFPVVFEDTYTELLDRFRNGLRGEEWRGELSRPVQGRFFLCRITPAVSNEGKKGISVLLEDITDRKRDEDRIRKSEARLRSIFRVSPVGIGVVSDRIIQEVNDRFCEMTGYSQDELVGRSARMLYPADQVFNDAGALYMSQIRRSGSSTLETQWVKKNGTVIDILLSSTPLDPANTSAGITFMALDITARNQALRALRESEERLQLALSGSETGMWWIDIPSMKGSVDERAAAVLGFRKNRRRSFRTDWDTLSHPDDVPQIHRRLADYLEGRTPIFESEHRMRHASGKWIWVVGRGKITHRSPDGSCKRLSGTIQDITGRKMAEEALRESENRYRTLSEASRDFIFLIGSDDRVEYVNSYAAAALGLQADQVIGQKRTSFFTGELGDRQAQGLRQVIENKKAWRSEGMIEVSGTRRWFDHYLMPIPDAEGTVTSVLGVSRDITERKLAEQALRESEEKYRHVVEQSLQGLTIIQGGRHVYANSAMSDIFGYSFEEYMALRPEDLLAVVHPDDRDRTGKVMADNMQGRSLYGKAEFRLVRKDGQVRWILASGSQIVYDGKPAIQVIFFDFTERRQAEHALRESESTARALLNAPTDTIILLDRRGVILDLNDTAALRLGKRREDLVGSLSDTVLPPDLARERRWKISEVITTGKPVRFIDVHGTTWFDNVVYPIPDNQGNVARLAVIARDITDQKNAECALRESEERYRKLVEISPNAVLLHREGKIIYANRALAGILGSENADDLLGRDVMDLIHPAYREVIRTNIANDLTGMPTPFMDLQIIRADGKPVTVQGQGVGTSIDGKPAVLVAIRDVPGRPEPDPVTQVRGDTCGDENG